MNTTMCNECRVEYASQFFRKGRRVCKLCNAKKLKAWRLMNVEHIREYGKHRNVTRQLSERDRENLKARVKKYQESEKGRETWARYVQSESRKSALRKYNNSSKASLVKNRYSLSDTYVRRVLKSNKVAIVDYELPQDLIDAKRIHLQILRTIKQHGKN